MSTVQESMMEPLKQQEFIADDFTYRPMPPLVPVCLAFVGLSLLSVLSEVLLIVPFVGILLASSAYIKISRSNGELSGSVPSLVSLVLMALMFLGFGGMHFHAYRTEVPEGYQRVNFTSDISLKGFEIVDGRMGIHPDVAGLAGKPIYLKGYMYPFRETRGLKAFVLCKDSGDCCFGGQPKPTDMILVNMTENQVVNYQDKRLIGVAGVLRVEQATFDESGLRPVYQFDCKHFAPAKTWY